MKWSFFILAIITVFTGCSNDEETLGNIIQPPAGSDTISIMLLKNADKEEAPMPRMIFSYDGWAGIELTNGKDGEHDKIVMQFVNFEEQKGVLMIADETKIMFIDNNPNDGCIGDECTVLRFDDSYLTANTYNIDWYNNSMTLLSTQAIPIGDIDNSVASTRATNPYDMEDTRSIIWKHIKDFGQTLSKAEAYVPGKAKDILVVWNTVVIPAVGYNLYMDNPDMQDEIRDELALEQGKQHSILIRTMHNALTFLSKVKSVINYVKDDFMKEDQESISEEQGGYIRGVFSREVSYAERMRGAYLDNEMSGEMPKEFKVIANVTTNGNSATITAECMFMGESSSYVSEFGFEYGKKNGPMTVKVVEGFPSTLTLSDLEWGETYIVTAYLRSFGKKYCQSKEIIIDQYFHVSIDELVFPSTGGSKGVYVYLPANWSWAITSHPKWCKIEPASSSFFVDVSEYNKNREGQIIVTGTSEKGDKKECVIEVRQMAELSWDHTKWHFKGQQKIHRTINLFGGVVTNDTENIDFYIDIQDVKKNQFSLSGDFSEITPYCKIYYNEQKQLVLYYSTTQGADTFVFIRTGPDSATATMTGSWKTPSTSEKCEGSFTGELVD